MAEPPDLQDLAKRYLDLWQDQLRAMAGDPELAASFARMYSAMTGQGAEAARQTADGPAGMPANPFTWWQMAGVMPTPPFSGGATPFDSVFSAGRGAGEARPKAATASHDGGGDELRELERRVAALEARLAASEPGTRKGGRGGKGKSRKREA